MREIKFRGKRIDNGEWIYGDLIHHNSIASKTSIVTESVKDYRDCFVVDYTVGQFTGLHDKDGKEIYEGDIVLIPKYGNCLVMWSGYGWGFHTVEQEVYPDGSMQYRPIGDYRFIFGQAVLVGNIHDNPELMKGGKE